MSMDQWIYLWVLIKRLSILQCYLSHVPDKAFLVTHSCRANSKKWYQYKCGHDRWHHCKWLKRRLFLLVKVKFGSCLNFLTLQVTQYTSTYIVCKIRMYLHTLRNRLRKLLTFKSVSVVLTNICYINIFW